MKMIRLTTPTQHYKENDSVELDAGNLEHWLKGLPVNDVIATIGKLDEAISTFNEVIVPAENRLKLLEVYHKSFHSILQGYDEMRLAQLKISSKQKHQLASDIMWLYIKLSHGYKIIVKEYVGKPNTTKPPQYLLLTVFRALELTVISMINSCRFGLDTPPLTYIEMHQLYAFAEYYELTGKPIKAAKGYAKTPTIASYYVLAMIFGSLDPSHYESYTLEVLFLALQPFAFHCPVTNSCTLEPDSYVFMINVEENRLPSLIVNDEICSPSETTRYLDIQKFIVGVESWLRENENNSNTLLIEHELELFPTVLTRLKANLNEYKNQIAENDTASVENQIVKLVFGFGPIEGLLIVKSADMGLYLNYNMSEWTVQSQSVSGCEVASHLELVNDDVSLGDLVAVVSGGEEGEPVNLLKIAYIHSAQEMDQGVLLAGLTYLDGEASPMTYTMISAEGETIAASQANGIHLLDEKADGQGAIMIVQRKHYHEAQRYLMKTREKVCAVEETRMIKQTLRYVFFQFRIVKEEPNHMAAASNIINLAV